MQQEVNPTTCGCSESHHSAEYIEWLKRARIWIDIPYFMVTQVYGQIKIERMHYRIDGGPGSKQCPNCGSRDTGCSQQVPDGRGGNWGWECNKCGLYDVVLEEWEN